MTLPGSTLTRLDSQQPSSVPTDTGQALFVGITERGPTVATKITSLSQFVSVYGGRQSYSVLYDSVDVFFREGGSSCYVIRRLGPTPVKASKALSDGSGTALTFTATQYGDFANSWTIAVAVGGGSFTITVVGTEGDGTAFTETLGPYTTNALAVSGAESTHGVLTIGTATDPVALSATVLTGGTDDHANTTDTELGTALGLLAKDLGPGQVLCPGVTTATAHALLQAHADTNNRVAYLDAPDTATVATITAVAATDRGQTGKRFSGLFAPWAVAPGYLGVGTRTVPYSAVQAGLSARLDRISGNPNLPAAGDNGRCSYVTGVSQAAWTDAQRETLATAGVNVARVIRDVVETFDFVTLTSPTTDANWLALSNARLHTAISADALEIADEFLFRQLDQATIQEFGGRLTGMLLGYLTIGALQGGSPAEAFRVDVGNQVNTPTTIAAEQLHAALSVRESQFGRVVNIAITKVASQDAIAA